MKKLLKPLFFILIVFTSFSLGIFSVKKLFPEEFLGIEKKSKKNIIQKMPFMERFFSKEVKNKPVKITVDNEEDEHPAPIEVTLDYFTNKDIYNVICETKSIDNPSDKFLGCNRCPKYLDEHNPDYFSLFSYAKGSVVKKNETEAIFFMTGCLEEVQRNGIAIVLRKGFGGWQRVQEFKNIIFQEPPLVFKDKQGYNFFIGKRKRITEDENKETLFSINFKNNKVKTRDFFSTEAPNGVKCNYHFLSSLDSPVMDTEDSFSVNLDVIGWEEVISTDCKVPIRNKLVHLKPGKYILKFKQKDDKFVADKPSQKIITELEKTQE